MNPSDKTIGWSIRTEDGIAGPYTLEQLRMLARQGKIGRHTAVRPADAPNWIRASQIPAIFAFGSESSEPSQIPVASSATPTPPPVRAPLASRSAQRTRPLAVPLSVLVVASAVVVAFVIGLMMRSERLATNPADTEDTRTSDTASASKAPDKAPTQTASDRSYTTEEIVAQTEHAVVTIVAGAGLGSGFLSAPNVVATNYHVIANDDGSQINCFFPSAAEGNRGPFRARLVAEDPKSDLALLRISSDITPLKLAETSTFRRGQDVIAIGSPALFNGRDILPNAITRGVVSSEHQLFGEPRYQLSMAINPGNSGGPVIGLDGKVVGVVVSKSRTEEGIGFCVPVSSLKRLMDAHASTKYAATPVVESEHLARMTARELVTVTLDLERFLQQLAKIVEEKSGTSTRLIPAEHFSDAVNRLITEINPEMRKDFSTQLRDIANDENLSVRLRSELQTLLQRHLALHAAIAQTTGDVHRMMSSLANLRERFLEQLRKVDRLLPLGFPELVE